MTQATLAPQAVLGDEAGIDSDVAEDSVKELNSALVVVDVELVRDVHAVVDSIDEGGGAQFF